MLRFLLDENLRGPLWSAIQQHNHRNVLSIDAVRVGDPTDLPLGSQDSVILLWAEREDRILLSVDRKTMAVHLVQHLQAGHHSPGVLLVSTGSSMGQMVSYLELAAHAGEPADYGDAIIHVP